MYSTCNLSLPAVKLPCISVILVFLASLLGFFSAPSSWLSQAGFVPTPVQRKLGLHHDSTSWALMCRVPASAGQHQPLHLCLQRWEAALSCLAPPEAAEHSRHREKEAPGSLYHQVQGGAQQEDSCVSQGRLAPNKLWRMSLLWHLSSPQELLQPP